MKSKVKNQIDKLLNPDAHMAKVRVFINPHPLDKEEVPILYHTVLTPYYGHDLDIYCASQECADTWIQLAGNKLITEGSIPVESWAVVHGFGLGENPNKNLS